MNTFRLAVVECVVATRCLEMQKLVKNEHGDHEWVHYCIVRNAEQALEVVSEVEPDALAQAKIDMKEPVIGSREEPLPNARIAKHLRGWKSAEKQTTRPPSNDPAADQ
jgi:hypothetical protein